MPTCKAGSTSIKATLLNLNEGERPHKIFNERTVKEVDNPEDYFTFTVVRNPFERIISCYKNTIKRTNSEWMKGYLFGYLYSSKDFKQFVKRIRWIPAFFHEPHLAPYYNIIYKRRMGRPQEAKRVPDFICRMENLTENWQYLKERFDLNDLQYRNVSKSDNWMDYFDEETAKLVYKFYKKDILAFGYEGEYQKLLTYIKQKEYAH